VSGVACDSSGCDGVRGFRGNASGLMGDSCSSELITVGASSDTSCLVETQSRTKTVVNTESESGKTVLQTIIQVVTQSASTESASASVGKK
jgi:hypothetical protein